MNLLLPVEHRIAVKLTPAAAFALFTEGLARWWPFQGHSCSGADVENVEFEPHVGGAVTEIAADGRRFTWGVIAQWNPPHGFAMSWYPGAIPEEATHLTVRFMATPGGCEVHLVHDGWAARGDDADSIRGSYQKGWTHVLAHYVGYASR